MGSLLAKEENGNGDSIIGSSSARDSCGSLKNDWDGDVSPAASPLSAASGYTFFQGKEGNGGALPESEDASISIQGYGSCLGRNDGKYISFEVRVVISASSAEAAPETRAWTVYRRYARFKSMGEAVGKLARKLKYREKGVSIPLCPGPGGLLASHTPEFLEKRRAALEVWLRNLLEVPGVCAACPDLVKFLTDDKNVAPRCFKSLARAHSPAPKRSASPLDTEPVRITVKPPPSQGSGHCGAGASAAADCAKEEQKVTLEDFQMIKVIGKGSFGKVVLVKKRGDGWFYAMKILRKQNVMRRNQVEHTQTERNVLGHIRHPFIVGLNYAFQTADKLFFVLDYCAGGELFFHLGNEGKFSEPRARFYAAEMALALSHLHSHDIVYRDLKPENVLLDHVGHVLLTDFGLSKEGISESFKGATSFCGTPEYLAPEILARHGHGQAVDWWSLGVLLYEMLTGLPPFYCRSRERLFEKIKSSRLKFPRFLSERVKDLLARLLRRDVAQRMGAAPSGFGEFRDHPFFDPIDWDLLLARKISPPWKPPLQHCLDTSQFDDEFTSMPLNSPPKKNYAFKEGRSGKKSSKAVPADYKWPGFSYEADKDWIANNPVSVTLAFGDKTPASLVKAPVGDDDDDDDDDDNVGST